MERIEARTAFKSSFLSEIALVSSYSHHHQQQQQHQQQEDVRGIANVTCCEDFSVDDLLDFSNKDFEDISFQESEEDDSSHQQESFNSNNSSQHVNLCNNDNDVVFGDLPSGGLSVPVDEMENLEWLSQIVDDTSTEVSLLYPVGNFNWNAGNFLKNRCATVSRPVVQRAKEPRFPLPACRKPRAKRPRPNGTVIWAIGSSPSVTPESSLTSNSLDGSSSIISPFLFAEPVHQQGVEKPAAKKQRKKHAEVENGTVSSGTQMLRRCTHCQVQKTPQWRAGPLGPKTLCNACGVRYKSGRLFPEYRPACSPTFSQEVHSNSHRKVLEMRRKKEVIGVIETGFSPMVQSF